MLLEKLCFGVLRVRTPNGPRYIKASFAYRVYLLWMFRHFDALPLKVLGRWQRRLIESLASMPRFVTAPYLQDDIPVLGTVDWPAEAEEPDSTWKVSTEVVRAAVARLSSVVRS